MAADIAPSFESDDDGPGSFFTPSTDAPLDPRIAPCFYCRALGALRRRRSPVHQRSVSPEPGVYFLGLPWQSRRGLSFIWGVWHDARFLADQIAIQRAYNRQYV